MGEPRYYEAMLAGLLAMLVAGSAATYAHHMPLDHALTRRWVYLSLNFQVDENVPKAEAIMRRAAKAGYNGIVIADYKLEILDLLGDNKPRYTKNIGQIKQVASELNLELIPTLSGPGYASGILAHDPNLAEGPPVKDAPFVVRNGQADIAPDTQPQLINGGFEEATNNRLAGFDFQDGIGKSTFRDTEVKHGGSRALRMEEIAANTPENTNCRATQTVEVAPWRQYHVSAWTKTDRFDSVGDTRIAVIGYDGRTLCFQDLRLQPTQDWTEQHITFNSQGNTKVRIYFGVWGGRKGKLWWDDAKIEETGLLNVVRRSECPLSVKSTDGAEYVEGKDFKRISDPRMGQVPWPGSFEIFHAWPKIILEDGSHIREGQRLLVSYFPAAIVMSDQVACSLTDPAMFGILENDVKNVHDLLSPKAYFWGHDEMRCAGWDIGATKSGKTPGQLLADQFAKCYSMVKRQDPQASVFVWSDMFDPTHNAHADYYMVNGTLAESWKGVPKDVVIVNWNSGQAKASAKFFADQGYHQVLAGYYDGQPNAIRKWLDDVGNLPGIDGVMYTTWVGNYSNLESFAQAAWGGLSGATFGDR